MSLKDALANSLLMFVAATCVVLIVRALPQTPPSHQAAASSADPTGDPMASRLSGAPTLRAQWRHDLLSARQHTLSDLPRHRIVRSRPCKPALRKSCRAARSSGRQSTTSRQATSIMPPTTSGAPNVVLAMYKDGKQVKWKGLPEVWEHVSDQAAFTAFVQTSLREFLGEPQVNPPMATN